MLLKKTCFIRLIENKLAMNWDITLLVKYYLTEYLLWIRSKHGVNYRPRYLHFNPLTHCGSKLALNILNPIFYCPTHIHVACFFGTKECFFLSSWLQHNALHHSRPWSNDDFSSPFCTVLPLTLLGAKIPMHKQIRVSTGVLASLSSEIQVNISEFKWI